MSACGCQPLAWVEPAGWTRVAGEGWEGSAGEGRDCGSGLRLIARWSQQLPIVKVACSQAAYVTGLRATAALVPVHRQIACTLSAPQMVVLPACCERLAVVHRQ